VVITNLCSYIVTSANTSTMSSASWNEGTGLISSLLPASNTATRTVNGKEITGSTLSSTAAGDPAAFNLQQGDLKLGPAPLRDNIREDAELQLREEDHGTSAGPNSMVIDGGNGTLTNGAPSDTRPSAESNSGVAGSGAPSALDLSSLNGTHGLVPPLISELLPQSPVYHSVDLKREIERVRDARKRIKLDPSLLYDGGSSAYPLTNGYGAQGAIAPLPSTGLGASRIPVAALPSICAYTFHDVADG
jgi:transcription initiation factor TFIID subunit 5